MKEKNAAIIIGIIVLAAFTIPFVLLSHVEKWYGSFLFWLMLTFIVIGLNAILTKDWSNEE
ncbi:hypothetical protein J18TS1_42980 [Oceanobacillus oncorhynchi subsp. incaldanensis]|uniref:Uncharacterized protein n=1 Tax=Oceanobacillus oncorhynchi TaxID=545501 RepID=A0A0A1MYZ7_9BACI|nr:hypothetical protein [Oceanobacillus oncorhynchi]UUI38881.1 hypothetical protein NP440_16280 [Oceanobacillus oncorhynchi]GIO21198.1 hypothetical protein J18TS1_42980 [Oceanobacillus oncorhynchi subsp. incaldanensis]CEI84592.1 hypothetical protein BN997_04546 [Oceanobacillus oncorhynchi]